MYLDKNWREVANLSDEIWNYAELAKSEIKSSKAQATFLEENDFDIEYEVGFPNSFKATWAYDGNKKYHSDDLESKDIKLADKGPSIGFLAEMDALDGLSQKALVTHKEPRDETTTGHGCGHNLLGAGCIGAALQTKSYLEKNQLPATIIVFGCPAEEAVAGKKYMAQAGTFDCCDIALSWHPSVISTVGRAPSLANITVEYEFKGVTAHAAASPQSGKNALTAVEIMNIGTAFLREQIYEHDTFHYSIPDAGCKAPNVIQDYARVTYKLRSKNKQQLDRLHKLIDNCAKGAALMTGTQVESSITPGALNLITNRTLEEVMQNAFDKVDPPKYTKDEIDFIASYDIDTEPALQINVDELESQENVDKVVKNGAVSEGVIKFDYSDTPFSGSTDVGDVSWRVPVGQITATSFGYKTNPHSWQWTSQGKGSVAHKGMIFGAKVLAEAAIHLIKNPDIIDRAQAEFKAQLAEQNSKV